MDAENSLYVKSIATEAPIFFGYIISVLASVPKYVHQNMYMQWSQNLNRVAFEIVSAIESQKISFLSFKSIYQEYGKYFVKSGGTGETTRFLKTALVFFQIAIHLHTYDLRHRDLELSLPTVTF